MVGTDAIGAIEVMEQLMLPELAILFTVVLPIVVVVWGRAVGTVVLILVLIVLYAIAVLADPYFSPFLAGVLGVGFPLAGVGAVITILGWVGDTHTAIAHITDGAIRDERLINIAVIDYGTRAA
jgi:hypothetical protein